MVRRAGTWAMLLTLVGCNTRDGRTDEAALAGDSAAASTRIAVPPASGAPADSGGRLRTVPGPLDVNPSIPRATVGGGGVMSGPATDTLRGIIALVGADPMVRMTLRGDPGGSVTLRGAPALATLSGLELWIAGVRADDAFDVSEFAVRAADGVPAVDGVLTERDGKLSLVRRGRSTDITGAPDAIRPLIGKRVWVTIANGAIQSFGVIESPR